MNFVLCDGGRADAGFKGSARDCGTRAIAIALELPYKSVYDELNCIRKELLAKARSERSKRRFSDSVRNGTSMDVMKEFFRRNNWVWVPTMEIGSGCKVHLREDELPKGRIVCRVSKHFTAVVDGVVWDTHDPSDGGSRCVYGYWRKRNKQDWLNSLEVKKDLAYKRFFITHTLPTRDIFCWFKDSIFISMKHKKDSPTFFVDKDEAVAKLEELKGKFEKFGDCVVREAMIKVSFYDVES